VKTSILVFDEETAFLDSVVHMLRLEGYEEVTPESNPAEVEGLPDDRMFDAAFWDITILSQ
jgi:hypothetical protein